MACTHKRGVHKNRTPPPRTLERVAEVAYPSDRICSSVSAPRPLSLSYQAVPRTPEQKEQTALGLPRRSHRGKAGLRTSSADRDARDAREMVKARGRHVSKGSRKASSSSADVRYVDVPRLTGPARASGAPVQLFVMNCGNLLFVHNVI